MGRGALFGAKIWTLPWGPVGPGKTAPRTSPPPPSWLNGSQGSKFGVPIGFRGFQEGRILTRQPSGRIGRGPAPNGSPVGIRHERSLRGAGDRRFLFGN